MMTVNRILSDTVMVVVRSSEMDLNVLSHTPAGWIIPNRTCTKGSSWLKEAALLLKSMVGPSTSIPLELMKTFRIWLMDSEYLYVTVFLANVEREFFNRIQKDGPDRFEIMSSVDIQELSKNKNLHPEVLDILEIPCEGSSANSKQTKLVENIKEELIYPTNPNSKLNGFINKEIPEDDQVALYACYLESTYPFLKLDESLMSTLMMKLGLTPFTSEHFRAADIFNTGCVDFRGFLGFIATLKGTCKEKAGTAERCKYVFRYYDKDRDDKLSNDEFEAIIDEIAVSKPNVNDKKSLLEHTKRGNVTLNDFAKMTSTFKLRGISTLLVNPSVFSVMKTVRNSRNSLRASMDSTISQKLQDSFRTSCSLGGHVVTISADGATMPVQTIDLAINTDPSGKIKPALVPSISSMEIFEGSSPAGNIMSALKFFTDRVFGISDEKKWFEAGFSDFAKNLKDCCNQAKLIFESEPRILRIDSPVYVIGDIHGRYSDILNFQKYFWSLGVECCPGSILFLGDYVDRGKNSVEVIAYLISQKIRNRQKIFLLRGNHETRKVQKEYTFFNECTSKFEAGAEVWETINEVMDRMPLAALVDGQVFCCHGGIPMPSQCDSLDDINKIPCPLPNPFDSKLAWALLWNDPQKVGYNTEKDKISANGFSKNSRRKTGHTFGQNALERFIEKHKLSYVVRAHEVQDAGFQLDLGNHLITVFSSSSYRGNNNSGCVLVQRNKIRIFTISPSSDVPTRTS